MSYLERFAPTQRELIVSLPYRVGLWISQSDTSGGDEADEAERQALHLIMTGYAEDFLKSEVVEEVMRQTIASKDRWDAWEAQGDKTLQDCAKALTVMEGYIRPEDILSFRQTLMDIGRTVAIAYCELDEEELTTVDMLKIRFDMAVDKLKARIQGKQPPSRKEKLNISPQERAALEKLSVVLNVTIEGKVIPDKQDDGEQTLRHSEKAAARKTDEKSEATLKG